jgi:hypothetical protein
MPIDTRTGTAATVGPREAQAAVRHHAEAPHADHLTAVVVIGAVLWLLGTAVVISWRDSGHRLRGILSEFDEPGAPRADARTPDRR